MIGFGSVRRLIVIGACFAGSGCAAAAVAPPVVPPRAPLPPADIDAIAALLSLEDSRDFQLPILLDFARSPQIAVRAQTAMTLARLRDPNGRSLARTLLADSDSSVVAAAAFALGQLRDSLAVGVLAEQLEPPLDTVAPTVAAEAARALGFIGTAPAAAALQRYLDQAPLGVASERSGVVALALTAMERIGGGGNSVARWLVADDPEVRWRAAHALLKAATPSDLAALSEQTSDPDPEVRALAIQAAVGASPPAALVASRANVTAGDSVSATPLELAARTAALRLGDPSARQWLTARAGIESHLDLALIDAAADRGDFQLLSDLATDPARAAGVRAAALTAAADLDPASALDLAERIATRTADWRIRAAAGSAVGAAGAESASRWVRDPDPRVALATLEAVLSRNSTDLRPLRSLLIELANAHDPHLRAQALLALGALRDLTLFPLLLDAFAASLDDQEHVAQIAALRAIAMARDAGIAAPGRAFFARFPRSADPQVRLAAVDAFGEEAVARWGEPLPIEGGVTVATYRGHVQRWIAPAPSDTLRPRVRIQTEAGTMDVQLYSDLAPLNVASFLHLASVGFFDGTEIADVVAGKHLLAGEPRGDGRGGPGFQVRDEPARVSFETGTIAVAPDGREAGGSRFLIALQPAPELEGVLTPLGRIEAGADVPGRLLPGHRIISIRELGREAGE